ncbi:hypothetical protein D3C79_1083950 [compost metagenome]
MILGTALGERLGHVFRNQEEHIVAVDIVFTRCGSIGNVRFNVFDSLTQLFRQPGL